MEKYKIKEDEMCRTREQVLAGNSILHQMLKEVESAETKLLESGSENGEKLQILRDRAFLEGEIRTIQNSDDIAYLRDSFGRHDRESIRYPSILYQLVKMPRVAYPLLVATGLVVWLVSSFKDKEIMLLLNNIGMKLVDVSQIRTGVMIAVAGLIFSSVIGYGNYLEKKFTKRSSDGCGWS